MNDQDPVDATADKIAIANDLIQQGRLPAAVKKLDEAMRLSPDPRTLLDLARLELANPAARQRALDHIKQALTMDPKFTDAWMELANYWGVRGNPQRQRGCLAKILAYDPKHREAREVMEALSGK